MPTPNCRLDRDPAGMPYKPEGRALKPYDIEIEPGWNGRDMNSPDTIQHIAEIAESIRARISENPPLPALIYPVKIRHIRATGKARLIAGECRLRACRMLADEGLEIYVPAVDSEQDATETQLLLTSLTENTGLPLTQWEAGAVYRRLHVGCSLSIEYIAAHACRSKRYVTEAIELARTITASPVTREMLNENKVTPGAVLHAVKDAVKNGHASPAVAAAEALAEAVAEKEAVAPPTLPGTRSKAAPVARPKKESATEAQNKTVLKLLDYADAMYKALDEVMGELPQCAVKYAKERELRT